MTEQQMAAMARDRLAYDPDTGVLTRRAAVGRGEARKRVGQRAGGVDKSVSYRCVSFGGKQHYEHRVIWLMVHGRWPKHQLDHVNGVRDDNRLCNLREATNAENNQNVWSARPASKTGLRGASPYRGRYVARIRTPEGYKHLGVFPTAAQAHAAYVAAKRLHHPTAVEQLGLF